MYILKMEMDLVKNNRNSVKRYVAYIFALFVISLFSCSDYKNLNNRDFIIVNCDKDTTIDVKNLRGQYATRNISLKVLGEIDDSSRVYIKDVVDKSNSGLIDFRIGKGNVNFKGKGEIYSQDYQIIYLHKKATKGHLKIRLQLLSPAGDTLTDNE